MPSLPVRRTRKDSQLENDDDLGRIAQIYPTYATLR